MTDWHNLPAHIKITYQSQAQYESRAIQSRMLGAVAATGAGGAPEMGGLPTEEDKQGAT